jgi:predicted CXXCH cytochrome family protein
MTVVGHVEQMHLSRCYQGSDNFSCLTCHDPHAPPPSQGRDAHYNRICTSCHRPERCTVDPHRRQKESPGNDCVQCHMPRSPTEVPHVAFTHHRVGIHDRPSEAPAAPPGQEELQSLLDLSRLSPIDRQRSLGLGYLDQATRAETPWDAQRYRLRALELLSEVAGAGLRDAVLDASLARARSELGRRDVLPDVEKALGHPDLAGQDRCVMLYLRAYALAKEGRPEDALADVRELTGLRRHQADWLLRADCERALGRPAAAAEALATAARINPRLWEVQRDLADYYARHGDPERAAWHRRRAVP